MPLLEHQFTYGCQGREYYWCNETSFYIDIYQEDNCGGNMTRFEEYPNDGWCVAYKNIKYMSFVCSVKIFLFTI